MPRPKIDAIRVIYDAESFSTMAGSLRRWSTRSVWIDERDDSIDEKIIARRRTGAEVFGRELLIAADNMKLTEVHCLSAFMIGEVPATYRSESENLRNLDDEVEEIRRLAIQRAANRGLKRQFPEELLPNERAEYYRGVNDLIDPLFMRIVDRMIRLTEHGTRKGKPQNAWSEKDKDDLKRVADAGRSLRLRVALLEQCIENPSPGDTVGVIQKIEQIRDKVLRSRGMDTAVVQPGFETKPDIVEDESGGLHLPAHALAKLLDVEPATVRKAIERKQLLPKVVPGRKRPYYPVREARALWPPHTIS